MKIVVLEGAPTAMAPPTCLRKNLSGEPEKPAMKSLSSLLLIARSIPATDASIAAMMVRALKKTIWKSSDLQSLIPI